MPRIPADFRIFLVTTLLRLMTQVNHIRGSVIVKLPEGGFKVVNPNVFFSPTNEHFVPEGETHYYLSCAAAHGGRLSMGQLALQSSESLRRWGFPLSHLDVVETHLEKLGLSLGCTLVWPLPGELRKQCLAAGFTPLG